MRTVIDRTARLLGGLALLAGILLALNAPARAQTITAEPQTVIVAKDAAQGATTITWSVIASTVERADGNSMLSKSSGRVIKDGKKVLVLTTFTPHYDPATYPDTRLFIPYWALNLQADNPNKMRLNVVLVGEAKQFARSAMDFGLALGKAR